MKTCTRTPGSTFGWTHDNQKLPVNWQTIDLTDKSGRSGPRLLLSCRTENDGTFLAHRLPGAFSWLFASWRPLLIPLHPAPEAAVRVTVTAPDLATTPTPATDAAATDAAAQGETALAVTTETVPDAT